MKEQIVSKVLVEENSGKYKYTYHIFRVYHNTIAGEFLTFGIAIYNGDHSEFMCKSIELNSIESKFLVQMNLLSEDEINEICEPIHFFFHSKKHSPSEKIGFLKTNFGESLNASTFRVKYSNKTMQEVLDEMYEKIVMPKFRLIK